MADNLNVKISLDHSHPKEVDGEVQFMSDTYGSENLLSIDIIQNDKSVLDNLVSLTIPQCEVLVSFLQSIISSNKQPKPIN